MLAKHSAAIASLALVFSVIAAAAAINTNVKQQPAPKVEAPMASSSAIIVLPSVMPSALTKPKGTTEATASSTSSGQLHIGR